MNKVDLIAWKLALLSLQTVFVAVLIAFWVSFLGRLIEAVLLGTTVIGVTGVLIDIIAYFKK